MHFILQVTSSLFQMGACSRFKKIVGVQDSCFPGEFQLGAKMYPSISTLFRMMAIVVLLCPDHDVILHFTGVVA